ncbi:MAG: antitoxin family protein [Bryobacteraceae bacterium]
MTYYVEAVYENGVLRPVKPLDLKDRQRVTLTVYDPTSPSIEDYLDHEYVAAIDAMEEEEEEEPTLKEVRHALSGIKGSLADAVREERDYRG